MPAFLLCVHPIARDVALGLLTAFVLFVLAATVLRRRVSWIPLAAWPIIIALALWLGSYSLSPLGFAQARIPLVSGFWVTRAQRPQSWVMPRQVVTMAEGSAIGIQTVLLPAPASCRWLASNGGSFEDPTSCDTAYEPSRGATFDILRLDVEPACGLPPTVTELRVSVLP